MSLFADLPPQVSLARQIESVKREITLRKRVYPNRIANHRMSEAFAAEEIGAMEAVLRTLEGLKPWA